MHSGAQDAVQTGLFRFSPVFKFSPGRKMNSPATAVSIMVARRCGKNRAPHTYAGREFHSAIGRRKPWDVGPGASCGDALLGITRAVRDSK